MSDNSFKQPRLLTVANDFYIDKHTLIDFLKQKGFETGRVTSETRLTKEMYDAIRAEFIDTSTRQAGIEMAFNIIDQCVAEKNPVLDLGNCGLVDNDFILNANLIIKLRSCNHITGLIFSSKWRESYSTDEFKKSSNNGAPNKISRIPYCITLFPN